MVKDTTSTKQPVVHKLNQGKTATCTAALSLCRIQTGSVQGQGARTQNLHLQRKLAQVLGSAGYELTMLNCCQFGVATPAVRCLQERNIMREFRIFHSLLFPWEPDPSASCREGHSPIILLKHFGTTHVSQMRFSWPPN